MEKIGVNEEYVIYLGHAGDLKPVKQVLEQIQEKFPGVTTEVMELSPSLVTHGGPGCVTIQVIKK